MSTQHKFAHTIPSCLNESSDAMVDLLDANESA